MCGKTYLYGNVKSLSEMEERAKSEDERNWSVKIRGYFLEVSVDKKGGFSYHWGKNLVTRETAFDIFASA